MIDPGTGVLETQRKLAEIVEMIHTAQVSKIFQANVMFQLFLRASTSRS